MIHHGGAQTVCTTAALAALRPLRHDDPDEHFPVVVVSAMAKVTDQLLRIARITCDGDDIASGEELKSLRHKHIEAAEKAGRLILDTYLSPNRTFVDLPELINEMDPLRDFSEACRRELQGTHRR